MPEPIDPRLIPFFGLNGSNGPEYLENLKAAWKLVEAAREKLVECRPNGRDYSPDDYPAARAYFDELQTSLHTVSRELLRFGGGLRKRNPSRAAIMEDAG